MNELDTFGKILAASALSQELTDGVLSTSASHALLHLNPTCTVGDADGVNSKPAPVTTLLDLVGDKTFAVCKPCLAVRTLTGTPASQSWAHGALLILRTAAHQRYSGDDNDPGTLFGSAERLVIGAAVWSYDSSADYERANVGAEPWCSPELQALHADTWSVGKRRYDEAVATGTATKALQKVDADRDPVLVVCGKGAKFLSPRHRRTLTLDVARAFAALLEGERLGQTKDWFITRATWGPKARPTVLDNRTFPEPTVAYPESYGVALGLWDGLSGTELAEIIQGVDRAIRT